MRNVVRHAALTVALLSLCLLTPARAQTRATSQLRPVDPKSIKQLGEIVAHLLEELYVSPEDGRRIAAQMRARFAAGAYDKLAADPVQLADALTRDLREIGKDKHLYVRYDPSSADAPVVTTDAWDRERQRNREERRRNAAGARADVMEPDARQLESLRRSNNYFRRVERLDGNVGYVDLGGFAPGRAARETAAGVMAFLANADAVIIDLRRCPGGAGDMVEFLSSYFFTPEPRVLLNMYFRPTDTTVPSATVADLPGRRMPSTDLYILTSGTTASACEAFPYGLQQYGRARVVGEPSAGAGYANSLEMIGGGFTLSVSVGRPQHPRTGKGWEGVGVQPDTRVPADKALAAAHAEALKKLAAATGDETRRRELTKIASGLEATLAAAADSRGAPAAPAAADSLQGYVGKYGENKTITVRDGGLFYQRIGGRGAPMQRVSHDSYTLNGGDARITFVRDAAGAVVEMLIDWNDGHKDRLKREPLPAQP
ncbi:MAG TPA: S41 family peptidase [Pyrinomonadaceae bacterium]|nr:S41 family peptidase [Pyrinomonadaceae bacterium]